MTARASRVRKAASFAALLACGIAAAGAWSARAAAQDWLVDDGEPETQLAASPDDGMLGGARARLPAPAPRTPDDRSLRAVLQAYWLSADAFARGTMLCLAAMLAGSGYVSLRRFWDQHLLLRSIRTVRVSFWTAPNLYEAVRNLEADSPFRAIAEDGLEAATHREGRLTDSIAPNEWIVLSLQRSVGAIQARLQQGIAFVSAVGSTAPLVGLLGTVWGAHRALVETAADRAAPIGTALVATAAGLSVAVLATFAARWLARRNEVACAAVRDFANDVQALLLSADALIEPPRALPSSNRRVHPGPSNI